MNTKLLFCAVILLHCFGMYSQQWSGSSTNSNLIYRYGNVTIGSTYNNAKFNIQGNQWVCHFHHGTNQDIYLRPGTSNGNILMDIGRVGIGTVCPQSTFHVYQANLPNIKLQNSVSTLEIGMSNNDSEFCPFSKKGDVIFRTFSNLPNHGMVFNMNDNLNDGKSYIRFTDNNLIILGIYNNGIVRVNGKLEAKELEIKTEIWGDFVFEKDYYLISLEDLEKYIYENNHLPGVPSEKEVIEKGINVSEMSTIMIQKIEELTLYIIEQNKILKSQEEKIKELQSELELLKRMN